MRIDGLSGLPVVAGMIFVPSQADTVAAVRSPANALTRNESVGESSRFRFGRRRGKPECEAVAVLNRSQTIADRFFRSR